MRIGAWASLIFFNNQKIVLKGLEKETTNNRMELMAVIKSIEHVSKELNYHKEIVIYTDSQYVERIPQRTEKLIKQDFETKSGKDIQNADLVKILVNLLKTNTIEFVKVKAHQKNSEDLNYNREVDKLVRKMVLRKVDSLK